MSFNTALSGIRAANTDLEVTGNNIANASTTGFKTSRVEFGDVYASSLLGSSSNTPGAGVTVQNIRQQFSQGNLNFTNNQLDLAVNGGGFFVVDNAGDQLYTRAGAFGLDQNGYVVTNTGYNLQGYAADADGNISGILSDLQVDVSTQAPRQTTGVEASFNLNANQQVLESIGLSFDTDGPAIGVSQLGLRDDKTTSFPVADTTSFTYPVTFGATDTFDITLADSVPSSTNGTVTVNLDGQTVDNDQELVDAINNAIFSSGSVNVQAVLNGTNIEIQDISEGVASTVTVASSSGSFSSGDSSTGGVPGQPAADNGYLSQQLEITGPDGATVTFTSEEGASAAQIASELNALPGVTATATTQAVVQQTGFNNANGNLQLNGVELSSQTLAELANEINELSTSTLPGVTAEVNTAGNLVLTSSVGTDLKFSFNYDFVAPAAESITVEGSDGAGSSQTLSAPVAPDFDEQTIVVGGQISVLMDGGYEITGSTPAIGNLFSPFAPSSFTEVPVNQFDPNDQATYNHATSNTIFDSMGNPHVMTQYFVKQPYDPADASTSPNHWVMYVQVDGQEVGDPDPTLPPPENTLPTRASFNVHFNQDGSLNESLTDSMLISNWTPVDEEGNEVGAFGPLNVLQGGTIPVAEPPASSNFVIDLTGSTQFGAEFAVEQLDQNGYTTGRLSGLDVSDSGVIFARFTNGEAQVLGQVALANFNNVEALKPVGDTMWAQSADTGEAIIGTPGSASLGSINSGALEESNVDLSSQLVNLIIAQRNFQASAKTIETANQTTQTIINLR